MRRKVLCIIVILSLTAGLLGGCSSGSQEAQSASAAVEPAQTAQGAISAQPSGTADSSVTDYISQPPDEGPSGLESAGAPSPVSAEASLTPEQQALLDLIPEGDCLVFQEYPLTEEGASLSVFFPLHPLLGKYITDPNELPFYQQYEAITGVHVDFTTVSMMSADTQAQLMIASGEYPDIMGLANYYTAGADAAVDDGMVVDLTGMMPQNAPNYYNLINRSDAYERLVTTKEGRLVGFSLYSMDNTRIYISGPTVRKDWLDEVGLSAPETLDEYHNMLLAFKNEIGCETPMWLHYSGINRTNQLTRAFGINGTQNIVIDGKVTSSLLQDGFKQYLQMMNQWYGEGLFDPDFFSDTDSEEPDNAVVAADTYGLFYPYASDYIELANYAADPDFELLPITDATQNSGDKLKISNGLGIEASAAGYWNVTSACEDPELALKWLDFCYSPDGWLLCNYGIEGVSFEYDDSGVPHWTDAIKNPDKPGYVAKSMYTMLQGPFLMHAAREFDGYTQLMIDASDIWAGVDAQEDLLNLPAYLTIDSVDQETVTNINSDISTYVEESLVKFIIGDYNLTADYDAFLNTLDTLKINDMLAVYQKAYDDYFGA